MCVTSQSISELRVDSTHTHSVKGEWGLLHAGRIHNYYLFRSASGIFQHHDWANFYFSEW